MDKVESPNNSKLACTTEAVGQVDKVPNVDKTPEPEIMEKEKGEVIYTDKKSFNRNNDEKKAITKSNYKPTLETLENSISNVVKKVVNDELKKAFKKNNEDSLANISNSLLALEGMMSIVDNEGNSFNLMELFADLRQTLKKYAKKVEEQEAIIANQRQQIDSYADDILFKTQKPLIEEMISIREMISKVLKGKNGKDTRILSDTINAIDNKIFYALKLVGVEEYNSGKSPFPEFKDKYQEIVPYTKVPIHKENEGQYLSVSSGYIWNMPAPTFNGCNLNREFIIKHEKVAKLQFDNSRKDSELEDKKSTINN